MGGNFPPYKDVMPKAGAFEVEVEIGLDLTLLERLCKIAKEFGATTARVTFRDHKSAVSFRCRSEERTLDMLIMPLNLDNPAKPILPTVVCENCLRAA